ncbi:recombinase family protein [Actinomadura sp. WMMA1423]|uniref:recombinase family protein n=1 Tax=Actinomadura sp. WMMA1423 TaxID=2591108 RepID=UPI00143D7FDD|nr:recombinase family protein [Actinomadura sp. WMMA1423]
MGAVFSRMEVKKIRRRVRTWHRGRAERGAAPRGHRAFGWTDDGIIADGREKALIIKAVEDLLAGKSQGTVLREWLEKGVKTPQGNDWSRASLRKMLMNPRLCGWRMIKGEIIEVDGKPVVGEWEPIITPEQSQAIRALYEARLGKAVTSAGVVGTLARDHREHKHLLSGILRCGRILPDGTMCGARLRVVNNRKQGTYRYYCKDKTQGGCGRLSRRGEKLDEFISEAVLAKLEERSVRRRKKVQPWPGQQELEQWEEAMQELRDRFRKRRISNSFYFDEVERLETDINRLRTERQRYLLTAEQAATDLSDIRRRWYSETDEDRLDLAQKRTYIRECFSAVIVHPAGKGHGSRGTFDPDLIEPVWREG